MNSTLLQHNGQINHTYNNLKTCSFVHLLEYKLIVNIYFIPNENNL